MQRALTVRETAELRHQLPTVPATKEPKIAVSIHVQSGQVLVSPGHAYDDTMRELFNLVPVDIFAEKLDPERNSVWPVIACKALVRTLGGVKVLIEELLSALAADKVAAGATERYACDLVEVFGILLLAEAALADVVAFVGIPFRYGHRLLISTVGLTRAGGESDYWLSVVLGAV